MATEQWTFPQELCVGDGVMISRDPSRSDETFARVTKLKPTAGAIDVEAVFPSGPVVFQHLWHKDDPRVKTQADRFHDSCSGVFWLTQRTTDLIALLQRMDTLEKRYAALERYVAGEQPDESAKAARKPTRTAKDI